jgi:hypothetical protein
VTEHKTIYIAALRAPDGDAYVRESGYYKTVLC